MTSLNPTFEEEISEEFDQLPEVLEITGENSFRQPLETQESNVDKNLSIVSLSSSDNVSDEFD
jgi:hypothetical protein